MPKLLMLQGLPGSGKSTYAKVLEQAGWVRVNKDTIRKELSAHGWVWSHEAEHDVIIERDRRITEALKAGKDVVSDDTNFGRKHRNTLASIAKALGAEFDTKQLDTPLEVCLERNAKRVGDERIPDEAITGMYNQFVAQDSGHFPMSAKALPEIAKVGMDGNLTRAIICDLDGTLAHHDNKRNVYDAATSDRDRCDATIHRILTLFYRHLNYQIIYLTGRDEEFRKPTQDFLAMNNCPSGPLWMRGLKDTRKDWIVKLELFNTHIRDKYDVEFVLDDRNQVVEMWRKLGLKCLQVADGDF